ncbi:MAG: purine-binding chemotaxis protein CheW [Gammaproteobacteria bacterium]|nr:MAG: purine-binding chemotaxis protein CheW [Gammaproteobacteria bacterium]
MELAIEQKPRNGSADGAVQGEVQQFLTFSLADEEYGVNILKVQEIKGWTPVTRIPNSPEYLRGVLNLRGTIVPIIDLRMRFNQPRVEYTPLTVVIVLSVATAAGARTIGIVVDSVSDVLNVGISEIKPTPNLGSKINTEFINGIAAANTKMIMLLDSDKLLTSDELAQLQAVH